MSFVKLLFFIFTSVSVLSAFRMVTTRNPVHAALYLILTFFSTALVWLLLEAEFLSIVLILVYVGAVMVMFLFVVMMLDINTALMREGFVRFLPIGAAVAVVMIVEMSLVLGPKLFGLDIYPQPVPKPADYSNTAELGGVLYTIYVYPFEIASVILLVAMVAAIMLTLRRRPGVKYQEAAAQVKVRREDRIRIVKMPVESRVQAMNKGEGA
ncbi:MAG: NADH-quinone oxidoreductase subunit J [Gammaproteobacteria bacterium]|nr:NADH-quinone oxidoreductase subunit J [Gammaproteobacteria bacterium]